jgi:ubiquinone/menaquinone biosynthesis C-methylase UbiE
MSEQDVVRTPDHVLVNRASWDDDAPNWVERGRTSWSSEPHWGIWGVSEQDLGLLPDVHGLDALELGCGTGYICAWLARRGARPVGLDNSGQQLTTAKLLQDEFDIHFPLVHGDAERLPFPDASFDYAISEYGAAIWCDPYRWIPEAARVLRPGGRLLSISTTAILLMAFRTDDDSAPAEPVLYSDYFGMHRFQWHDEDKEVDAIEFHLTYGEMIRLLRSCGFEVEDLVEIRAPEGREGTMESDVPWEWARRWPSVEAWKARKIRSAG